MGKQQKAFTFGNLSAFGTGSNIDAYIERGMIEVNTIEIAGEKFLATADDLIKVQENARKIESELLAQKEAEEKQRKIQQLQSDLDDIEKRITRLERIKERTEEEEQELEKLYDESTDLFRKIEALQ